MKIIQQGIADTNKEIRLKCSICGAICDVTSDDIEKTKGVRTYFTKCPNDNCKRSIEIREGAIPRNILWEIDLRGAN